MRNPHALPRPTRAAPSVGRGRGRVGRGRRHLAIAEKNRVGLAVVGVSAAAAPRVHHRHHHPVRPPPSGGRSPRRARNGLRRPPRLRRDQHAHPAYARLEATPGGRRRRLAPLLRFRIRHLAAARLPRRLRAGFGLGTRSRRSRERRNPPNGPLGARVAARTNQNYLEAVFRLGLGCGERACLVRVLASLHVDSAVG